MWLVVCLAGLLTAAARGQGGAGVPVYIEDSPAAQELVEQARVLRQQGRVVDAVARLQQVQEAYGEKLMPIGDGVYLQASHWVRREIGGDEELLATYLEVYEPAAERGLAAARVGRPAVSALEDLVATHYLTASGLAAGLDLAAVYLERADLSAAIGVLDELADHPGLSERAVRYHTLAATASLLTGDEGRLARELERLERVGGAEATAPIDALSHRVHPPLRVARLSERAAGLGDDLGYVDQPLWRVGMEQPDRSPRSSYGTAPSRPANHVVPVADRERLYVNQGHRLEAVDRYSGRTVWVSGGDAELERTAMRVPAAMRMARTFTDRRGVAVSGDSVYAVVGQATVWHRGGDGLVAALARIDRETGEVRWRVEPGELDPSLERVYFQGTPVVVYDRVYALARRHQAAGFQDTLVVAVDAATGGLLWRRHISSAVTASRYAATPAAQMMFDDGTLYVADNLAVVAAIAARSGSLRWEHVFAGDQAITQRGMMGPGAEDGMQVLPPVLVEAGLVVPPSRVKQDVVVLDPQTGRLVRTLGASESASMSYVLAADGDVLGVGERVTLYDGETLKPRWRAAGTGAASGLAAVTGRYVVIPADDRLVVVRRDDGSVVHETAISGGGNVAVGDGQLLLADADGVSSYMSWNRAHEAMLAQLEREPTDPGPGLAMTHLAVSRGEDEAAIRGADFAVAAVDRTLRDAGDREAARRTQQRVFDQLLGFAERDGEASLALRSALFDRIARLSGGAQQEVAYHLSVGRLREDQQRWGDAVEHYQAVLLNGTLSGQLYHHQDVLRQAGLEARRRLTQLVESQGPGVYQRYDLIAGNELEQIRRTGRDPARLIELASRYPLAEAASRALLEAGQALIAAGRPGEAVTQLRRAYVRSKDGALLAAITGSLAEAYEEADRPRQAMQWLRRVSREYPGLLPLREGEPTPIETWMGELAAMPRARGVHPTLSLPLGRPYQIRGTLVLPTNQPAGERIGDRVLTREGTVLRLHRGVPLEPVWEASVPDADVELLAINDEHLILWSETTGELSSLDTTTGEAAWPSLKPIDLLDSLSDGVEPGQVGPPEQREFMQMIDVNAPVVVRGGRVVVERAEPPRGYLTAVGDGVICVADRQGGVVGVDRHSGRVLWQTAVQVERVSRLTLEGDALAVAGVSGAGTDAMSGAIRVLDPLTGEAVLPVLEDKEPAQWIGFVGEVTRGDGQGAAAPGDGLMLVATSDQVTAHRLDDGEVVWRLRVAGPPLTGRGWAGAELLLLDTNGDALLAIDPATGELRQRLRIRRRGGGAGAVPTLVEGQWQLMGAANAMALRSDGRVAWRAARGDGAGRLDLVQQFVGDQQVILLSGVETSGDDADMLPQGFMDPELAADPRRRDGRRLLILDRITGRLEGEYRLADLPGSLNPEVAQFLEDHLAVASGDNTVVIPSSQADGSE